ncbi:MAG: trypsin-like peptidase domain-containing protein [bacterium]|nr:PDZ domain-containing protein [Candidatus Sumerlaeota bacterium]
MKVVTRKLMCAWTALAVIMLAMPAHPDQQVTRTTFRDVAKNVSPAVVNIKVKSGIIFNREPGKMVMPPMLGLDDEMRQYLEDLMERQLPNLTPNDEDAFKYARTGSGVVIRPDGHIVTSNHVIAGIKGEDVEVSMSDGRVFDKVKIIGADELTDLAVIKAEANDLPTLKWGDSEKLEVGEIVMAVGNPLDFNNSVSEGIVSAKHRIIKKAPIEDLIQTTAMINPGNSGGALVNLDSELIGINMAIATNTNMWSGIGFAIPSKTAREVTDQIISSGKVSRGFLGVIFQPLTNNISRQLGYNQNFGVIVKDVRPNTAADKAGIQRYDIIAKINDKEIKDPNDMHRTIGVRAPGDTVNLEVFRDEGDNKLNKKMISVKLDERPAQKDLEKIPNEPKIPGAKVEKDKLLGIKVSPAPDGKGVMVDEIEKSGKAALAGIQKGDVIMQVNKQDVNNEQDLQKALKSHQSEGHLFYIVRKGQSEFVTIMGEL